MSRRSNLPEIFIIFTANLMTFESPCTTNLFLEQSRVDSPVDQGKRVTTITGYLNNKHECQLRVDNLEHNDIIVYHDGSHNPC